MADLSEIARNRGNPGIIVVDGENRVLYMNREAMEVLPDFSAVPEKIRELCECLKRKTKSESSGMREEQPLAIIRDDTGGSYSARAFLLTGKKEEKQNYLVLLERIVEHRRINVDKIGEDYHLTRRETEVLVLLSEGCTNREIAGRLYITEQTAKDHLRHVMRKMGVTSRGAVLAAIR